MVINSPPQEPTDIITTDCNVKLLGIKRTVLKISPHCWKRNEEFRQSKKKKVRENLEQYLLDEKIIKNLIQQINEKEIWFEGINSNWSAWKYYAYDGTIDQRNELNYLIIFFLDDGNPELIGVITVYPWE